MYIPEKGDIVWFNFDPSAGKEIMKRRPAYIISRKAFNAHTGLAIVAPITSTIRNMKLEVVLPAALVTKGAILVHQLRSLDYKTRKIEFVEKATDDVADRVSEIASLLVK
ncbi:MAG: type II toxin-antitoxin system PemK/MazF family toxin [Pseudomonadota bacterium]|nr:type II toxin-antitoxin system PemK/MazF family toxin [Pseudomonadota bacterium]